MTQTKYVVGAATETGSLNFIHYVINDGSSTVNSEVYKETLFANLQIF